MNKEENNDGKVLLVLYSRDGSDISTLINVPFTRVEYGR